MLGYRGPRWRYYLRFGLELIAGLLLLPAHALERAVAWAGRSIY